MGATLVAATCVVYAAVWNHEFLLNWDDGAYVLNNEAVRDPGWQGVRAAFTSFTLGNYAPVQILSYMADSAVWGLRPRAFAIANVIVHLLNGLMVLALVAGTMGRRIAGFAAAWVFLFHPVQVESVAWISQRKTLLAMFFFLAALHAYRRWREPAGGRRAVWLAASLVAFALSLLAKPAGVVLPLVLVLHDLALDPGRPRRGLVLDKLPYAALAVAAALVAVRAQSPEAGGGATDYHGGSPLATFWTMLPVVLRYLGMLVWPARLSALYDPPIRHGIDAAVAVSAVAIAGLAIVGVLLGRRDRRLLFWYGLFFLGLVPVLQIVPLVTLVNDRYLYFPMVGAAALVGIGADAVATPPRRAWTAASAVALAVALLALPVATQRRVDVWKNDLTLWRDVTLKTPGAAQAWVGLGMSLRDAGDLDGARDAFLEALRVEPDDKFALNDLGALFNERREYASARPYLERVALLFPDHFSGAMNLGIACRRTGDLACARSAFERALSLRPDSAAAAAALREVRLETGGMRGPEPRR